jgi:hypothetical protein
MMTANGIDDTGILSHFASHIHANLGVVLVGIRVNAFSDVV